MATIIRFNIPNCVANIMGDYDENKVINAVQSDLNAGTILASKTAATQDWKTVKDDDGNERQVIIAKTKTGERCQLENTIPNKFYAWCSAMVRANSFAATEVTLPAVFKTWLDKFAKLPVQTAKAS